MQATLESASGRRLLLVVCVIPIRLHYSLISRQATQPARTGPEKRCKVVDPTHLPPQIK